MIATWAEKARSNMKLYFIFLTFYLAALLLFFRSLSYSYEQPPSDVRTPLRLRCFAMRDDAAVVRSDLFDMLAVDRFTPERAFLVNQGNLQATRLSLSPS
jgi:hypothetical protein